MHILDQWLPDREGSIGVWAVFPALLPRQENCRGALARNVVRNTARIARWERIKPCRPSRKNAVVRLVVICSGQHRRLPALRACLAVIALLWPVLVGASRPQEQPSDNVIHFVRNPDPAPDFKLDDLDGKPLTLASTHGKVVLLNFWATWCGPCREEIPDLIALQAKYKDSLQIIGLSVDDDDASVVKKVVDQTGINYPVAMSSADVRMAYGGIGALPTSFVLDSEGRVVQKHEGLRDPLLYEIEVRALLGMPIPARVETFEDTGEIFLKHADRASALPGVDLAKLTPDQKQAALHRFNAETCTCGCKFTLAQCRIYDRGCSVSKARTGKIIAEVSGAATQNSVHAKPPAPSGSAASNSSPR